MKKKESIDGSGKSTTTKPSGRGWIRDGYLQRQEGAKMRPSPTSCTRLGTPADMSYHEPVAGAFW